MPYNKSYRRYNKRYKRRTRNYHSRSRKGYLGYAGIAVSTASKALAVAYGIKRLMNVEFKFHDVQSTSTAITSTPLIVQLTNIPQGDTSETRDGAQVKITRIQIKYKIDSNPTPFVTLIRVMLIHDSQTNQAIYAATDLLEDITQHDAIVSMLNLDNKYRFSVLYNKVHYFGNANGSNGTYKEIMKDMDLRIRFDASTPDITDLTSSSLSLLFVSTATTNTPLLTLFSRIRYVDN